MGGEGWRPPPDGRRGEAAGAVAGDKKVEGLHVFAQGRKLGGREGFLILFNLQDEACQVVVESRRVGQQAARAGIAGVSTRMCPAASRPAAGTRSASKSAGRTSAATWTAS